MSAKILWNWLCCSQKMSSFFEKFTGFWCGEPVYCSDVFLSSEIHIHSSGRKRQSGVSRDHCSTSANPRSSEETDHPFAEPGLFVVNDEGKVHVVDISNNPFVRPELQSLISGLDWIRNPANNYPIRGMHK